MENIFKFISQNHLLHLAVSGPYIASCFYVFKDDGLVFCSDENSTHMQKIAQDQWRVALSITSTTAKIARIRGVQMCGYVLPATKSQSQSYLARYPLAKAIGHKIWQVKPQWIKFTDNTLGFAKKTIWQAQDLS